MDGSLREDGGAAACALPYLLLALTALLWSGNLVMGRAGREVLPPIAFNFWRWAVALVILLPASPPSTALVLAGIVLARRRA